MTSVGTRHIGKAGDDGRLSGHVLARLAAAVLEEGFGKAGDGAVNRLLYRFCDVLPAVVAESALLEDDGRPEAAQSAFHEVGDGVRRSHRPYPAPQPAHPALLEFGNGCRL